MRGVEVKKIGAYLMVLCLVVVLTSQFGIGIFSAIILFLIGGIIPGTNVVLSSNAMLIGSICISVIVGITVIYYVFIHHKKTSMLTYGIATPLFVSRRDVHRHSH